MDRQRIQYAQVRKFGPCPATDPEGGSRATPRERVGQIISKYQRHLIAKLRAQLVRAETEETAVPAGSCGDRTLAMNSLSAGDNASNIWPRRSRLLVAIRLLLIRNDCVVGGVELVR